MKTLSPLNAELQALADEHRHWLSRFDSRYLANWDRLFRNNDESAMVRNLGAVAY